MDADELDDLESPVKKTFGSRARRLNIFGNNTTDIPTNAFASNGSGEGSKAPPKPRRNSGWAEDNSSSGLFRFRRSSARPPSTVPIEASKLTRNETVLERDDSDSEIPSIPDLGEVEYDDLATQVAQAPSVSVNQVDTFQQLDNELLKQAAFTTLDGCDLRLLTKYLTPEEYLKEPDAVWTWDTLFTEVAAEINKSSDNSQEPDDKQNIPV
ncbi:intraflagellar transport protein 43 homolog isoform X4 [Dermacentor andersoni]|uniref:intraflagellar transport protein 43 homolog isoform X4 n=1 Tax=Dermacentor andersoni TaxID=34620 RepID=UPI00215553B0|nr:intraflagellar transport protein 43 homolog isoform X1 [Dermacentor andersoni]